MNRTSLALVLALLACEAPPPQRIETGLLLDGSLIRPRPDDGRDAMSRPIETGDDLVIWGADARPDASVTPEGDGSPPSPSDADRPPPNRDAAEPDPPPDLDCPGGGVARNYWPDFDGDGFGDDVARPLAACEPLAGNVTNRDDCDDSEARVNPDASEHCDGRDEDCDDEVDDNAVDGSRLFADEDGDGYGNERVPVIACEGSPTAAARGGDCDDLDRLVAPNAAERCNAADDDCDGRSDENVRAEQWHIDGDGDGFGGREVIETCDPPPNVTFDESDCDDDNEEVNPFADEMCNDVDDDCNDVVDDRRGFAYRDEDGDGIGGRGAFVEGCAEPGFVADDGDCDDADDMVFPGAAEVCDGLDQDCDFSTDEDLPERMVFRDQDGDGWGWRFGAELACGIGAGYAERGEDCDDDDETVNPGAMELCDQQDNNCDGEADDGLVFRRLFRDRDMDGYGESFTGQDRCDEGPGYAPLEGDCDEFNPARNPGQVEVCDGEDNDCDSDRDEGLPIVRQYRDQDGDGFGQTFTARDQCAGEVGYVALGDDCDDFDDAIFPGAPEVCDFSDQDCDRRSDEGLMVSWYVDFDGDGCGQAGVTLMSCEAVEPGYSRQPGDCDDFVDNLSCGC